MALSSIKCGEAVAQSYRPARGATKRLAVVVRADRRPFVVNAALATRAPSTFVQPVPWIEIFQALVLPAPVADSPKPQPKTAEEECPWIDEMEVSHRKPMYFSHLADRMAMERNDD